MGRKFVLDAERGSTSCCCGACYCSKKVKLFWYVFLGIPLLLLLCMLLGILINAAVFKDPYHRYVFSEDPPQMLEVDRLLRDTMAERLSEVGISNSSNLQALFLVSYRQYHFRPYRIQRLKLNWRRSPISTNFSPKHFPPYITRASSK